MQAGKRPQHLAFGLASIVLVASGILFSSSGGHAGRGVEVERRTASAMKLETFARRVEANTARLRDRVEVPARRFVDAYLRYEVGIVDPGVRAAIRGAATEEFASVLLANTPRAPTANHFPEPARLQSLEVSFANAEGNRAIAAGAAVRGRMPEKFSFELEPMGGDWLVSGVAAAP